MIKIILIFILLFNSFLFSQNNKAAFDTIKNAEDLQKEGKYDDSVRKSTEAVGLIERELLTTLHDLMKIRISQAKEKADTSIANSKRTAVENDNEFKSQIDEVNKLYTQAGEYNTAGVNAGDNYSMALENYNKSLGNYNNVAINMDKILSSYLNRETATAKAMIDNVKTLYDTALKNGAITKDDATDKLVSTAITEANGALASYNFSLVKQKTDGAVNLIETANKTLAEAKVNAQKIIDEATVMYNDALSKNAIVKGDDNDKKVSDVLASGNANLQKGDVVSAIDNANEAKKMIEQIDQSNTLLMSENLKLIEETKKRRDDFIQSNIMIIDGRDDREVMGLIGESEGALNKNDQKTSKDKIVEANNKLSEVELRKLAPRDGDIIPGGVDEGVDKNALSSLENENRNTGNKIMTLPQYYVVVRRVPLTDALWRIAERSYIYNDPLEWTKIYEVNRRVLRDPRNPDLILPGQRLTIPSIRGERREGVYDPTKEYITIDEAVKQPTSTTNTDPSPR